MQANHVKKKLT